MTINGARALVREYFHVTEIPEIDTILCAALRRENVRPWTWQDGQMPEETLRAKLSSIKALFARSFGLTR